MNFDEILEEALNAVPLYIIERDGKLLETKKTDYIEKIIDVDCGVGGKWLEAFLYEYEDKLYTVVYECIDVPFEKRQCIKFSEKNNE